MHWVTAQQQLSVLLDRTVKCSFGWECDLNHLHISAGLKSFTKVEHVAATFSPIFIRSLVCVVFMHVCPAMATTRAARLWLIYGRRVWWCYSSVSDGIDFYYGSKQHAQKMVDFLQCTVPCRWAALQSVPEKTSTSESEQHSTLFKHSSLEDSNWLWLPTFSPCLHPTIQKFMSKCGDDTEK